MTTPGKKVVRAWALWFPEHEQELSLCYGEELLLAKETHAENLITRNFTARYNIYATKEMAERALFRDWSMSQPKVIQVEIHIPKPRRSVK